MGFLLVLLYFGLAALAAFVILQPDRFVVSRTAVVDASPAEIFRRIDELRNWESWSPWAKLDPNAVVNYSGPPSGAGAAFDWSGDKRVGEGRLTIVNSQPNEVVDFKLDMRKPFAASNDVSFVLQPEGERTRVTWIMAGRNTLLAKAMGLIVSRDKMIGGQFERGLENLATVCVR